MSICLAKQVFAQLDIFAVGEFDIIVKKRFRYDINPRSRSEHIEHLRSKCYIELRTQHIENPHKRIYIDARLLTAGALHTRKLRSGRSNNIRRRYHRVRDRTRQGLFSYW